MPSRIIPFVNGEYYHIFNRGVAKMPIYLNAFDYKQFINTMLYYQIEGPKPRFSIFKLQPILLDNRIKLIDIICYCLMPNHFHLILRQIKDTGITEFVGKLSNSYTKYFNIKNKRVGPLLQGEFKSVYIGSDEQITHLSRYIHLNPLVGYVTKDLRTYRWSSYPEYLGTVKSNICSKEIVLGQFKLQNDYGTFVFDQVSYAKELDFIKHQLLDSED